MSEISNHLLTSPTLTESPRPLNRSLDAPHVLYDLTSNLRILRLEIVPLRASVPVHNKLESGRGFGRLLAGDDGLDMVRRGSAVFEHACGSFGRWHDLLVASTVVSVVCICVQGLRRIRT